MENFMQQIRQGELPFSQVLQFIEGKYRYTPGGFHNGAIYNSASENQGSAKVLFFAHLNHLSAEDTLLLFAEHYRAVMEDPEGQAHQNIRQFQQHGWEGVRFENNILIIV